MLAGAEVSLEGLGFVRLQGVFAGEGVFAVKSWAMRKSLAESEREELLAELTEAHNVVSKVLSELRSRYSVKSPTMKAAIKAEWAVFHLKRELLRMDVEKTPPRTPLPKVQRGGKVVDVEEL